MELITGKIRKPPNNESAVGALICSTDNILPVKILFYRFQNFQQHFCVLAKELFQWKLSPKNIGGKQKWKRSLWKRNEMSTFHSSVNDIQRKLMQTEVFELISLNLNCYLFELWFYFVIFVLQHLFATYWAIKNNIFNWESKQVRLRRKLKGNFCQSVKRNEKER